MPSGGTNNGFGDRVAAIRFSAFSSAGIGGEAALTKGPPMLDIQTAGGLYDAIGREALTQQLLTIVDGVLPAITVANFCERIATERHLDVNTPAFGAIPAQQRAAIGGLDRLGNTAPKVMQCTVRSTTVTFLKAASFAEGSPPRQVYGAVRFLPAPYSTFQLIRAGGMVDAGVLAQMEGVVNSWKP